MAQSLTQTRPRRTPRVLYPNDDSDSDDFAEATLHTRPSRATRRVETYRESSDDETSASLADDVDSEPDSLASDSRLRRGVRQPLPIQKPFKSASLKRKDPPVTRSRKSIAPGAKRQKTQSSYNVASMADKCSTDNRPSNMNSPRWKELPYLVLVNIMQYAAYPLVGPLSRIRPSVDWLSKTSRVCRVFHEPCMAALLYSPPLDSEARAQSFMDLLKAERKGRIPFSTPHGVKIRYLDIEVKQLLVKKSGISLDELISLAPLLRGIRLYSNYDEVMTITQAQPEIQKINWGYPVDLFTRLENDQILLRSFEWNGRFPDATDVLKEASAALCRPAFSHLREVAFLNLGLPANATDRAIVCAQRLLAAALSHMPEVRSLSFRNCAMLDEITVSMVPSDLFHLEVANCPNLTSGALESYLTRSGTSLQTLKLDGNRTMDLGFMAKLKTLCPRLQRIQVDMLFIAPSSYTNRRPAYSKLLPKGPPTWPGDLTIISIENMRQLTKEDAERFFASLVDSAEHLPRLKKLNLKMILTEASWRDRAQLRRDWLSKLEAIFLNTAQPTPSASKRHSTRRRGVSSCESNEDSDVPIGQVTHARCDVVDLAISDQRPAETQFHEEDFMDSEPSGDTAYHD